MELINLTETETSNVTLVSDDETVKHSHIFNYNLNEEKTRKKIYEGAFRGPFTREEKSGAINLIFNDGAFNAVVLKAIIELNNGPKHFIVGKEEVERIAIDHRKELSGKHMDTKIEF